jgi:rare lipoprotein A
MKLKSISFVALYLAICVGCITRAGQPDIAASPAPQPAVERVSSGNASFYGSTDGLANRKTASGERYNPNALTAAHKTLPLGSKVKVTNEKNGKQVIVTINDRGPFAPNRIIDLSSRAAKKIDLQKDGVEKVRLEPIPEEGKSDGDSAVK